MPKDNTFPTVSFPIITLSSDSNQRGKDENSAPPPLELAVQATPAMKEAAAAAAGAGEERDEDWEEEAGAWFAGVLFCFA
jgi:hypothetical protein